MGPTAVMEPLTLRLIQGCRAKRAVSTMSKKREHSGTWFTAAYKLTPYELQEHIPAVTVRLHLYTGVIAQNITHSL